MDGRFEEDENQSLAEVRQWLTGSSLEQKVCVGSTTLQGKLQNELLKHTLEAVPNLKSALEAQDKACRTRLEETGTEPPLPLQALMSGIQTFHTDMKEGFDMQLGAIRKATENMADLAVSASFRNLESIDPAETRSALQFLKQKCKILVSDFEHLKRIEFGEEWTRALHVRCVLERHRRMYNIQFSDHSVLLRTWMPLFSADVEPVLREFVTAVFRILKVDVVGPALKALARQHNRMLKKAEEEILGPRAFQVLARFQEKAEDHCNDLLTWSKGKCQFTSNEQYLQESAKLSDREKELGCCFAHLTEVKKIRALLSSMTCLKLTKLD